MSLAGAGQAFRQALGREPVSAPAADEGRAEGVFHDDGGPDHDGVAVKMATW